MYYYVGSIVNVMVLANSLFQQQIKDSEEGAVASSPAVGSATARGRRSCIRWTRYNGRQRTTDELERDGEGVETRPTVPVVFGFAHQPPGGSTNDNNVTWCDATGSRRRV